MSKISIYTDEDVHGGVVLALRRPGVVASSTPEHGNLSLSDKEQIRFATSLNAVFLTHNMHDFPRLHYEMLTKGESHKGGSLLPNRGCQWERLFAAFSTSRRLFQPRIWKIDWNTCVVGKTF